MQLFVGAMLWFFFSLSLSRTSGIARCQSLFLSFSPLSHLLWRALELTAAASARREAPTESPPRGGATAVPGPPPWKSWELENYNKVLMGMYFTRSQANMNKKKDKHDSYRQRLE